MKKNISRPQYYRVRHILEMIRAAGEDGKLPNARDFCRELRVSRATVIRDLDWLRDEENAPVEYVAERHGYRLSDMTWQVPPLRLSRKEVFAFAMADKLLTAFRGTPLEREMRSAFQKVSESLEGNVTIDSTAFGERLSLIPDDYVVQDPDIWSAVAGCVDRQERAEMVYEKFNTTAGWKELVRWILSWQPDCRVLSPACLRKRVEEKMREALA